MYSSSRLTVVVGEGERAEKECREKREIVSPKHKPRQREKERMNRRERAREAIIGERGGQ